MTNALGEMVVGWEKPKSIMSVPHRDGTQTQVHTLGNLLAAVDLGNLLLKELVALLADVEDLLAGNA